MRDTIALGIIIALRRREEGSREIIFTVGVVYSGQGISSLQAVALDASLVLKAICDSGRGWLLRRYRWVVGCVDGEHSFDAFYTPVVFWSSAWSVWTMGSLYVSLLLML